ncbi:hypothetical protein QFZ24_009915 [Streptomyces phaeochromogenes]|nr:hypothetical protein [Streptomyces phaeochromogenes]
MNRARIWPHRAALLAVTVITACVLPLASAGTAAAAPSNTSEPTTSGDCLYILNTSGYGTTPDRVRYCNIGEGGGWIDNLTCTVGLNQTGVNGYVAQRACDAADD